MILTVKLTGIEPILMNSDRTVNKLDKGTKELATLVKTPSAKKTDEILMLIQQKEFELGLYIDDKLGPYIPSRNLFGMVWEGAKFKKNGMEVKRAVQILTKRAKLEYDGPRDFPALLKSMERFAFTTSLPQGQVRIMRTRPQFQNWGLQFQCIVDDERLNFGQIKEAIETAGKYVGLGDSRPQFGTFSAEVKETS